MDHSSAPGRTRLAVGLNLHALAVDSGSGLLCRPGGTNRALDTGHLSKNGFCGGAVVKSSVNSELVVQVLALPGLRVHEECPVCANHGSRGASLDVPDVTNRCFG